MWVSIAAVASIRATPPAGESRGSSSPGTLVLANSSRSAAEGDGWIAFAVRRVGGNDGVVSVEFDIADGSASANVDYQPTMGALIWDDGDDENKQIIVAILDDSDPENDEVLNVLLSNPTGGAALGAPSTATGVIVDDDAGGSNGVIRFLDDTEIVSESGGVATVTAARSGAASGAVTVDFFTSNGSALAPDDYTSTLGTLVWEAGESGPKSIDVPIIDDTLEESLESITVGLVNPSGGAILGAITVATILVTDNDSPIGPCVPDETTACLNESDRFRVTMTADLGKQQIPAKVLDIGQRDSTVFYFNQPRNAEVLIKVLNGCSVERLEGYWVLLAATTDRGYTLVVTDTLTGEQRFYTNELGRSAETVIETPAFVTCP